MSIPPTGAVTSKQELEGKVARQWLSGALGLADGGEPFPWQTRLLESFRRGEIPASLDIPTGMGKTGVMAVWLVARARGAPIPRRLVYVVDRRAVVDQSTRVAVSLREFVDRTPALKDALGLADDHFPISTLRGQYIANREWLDNPASPAIIVGTVDMIGSRLLFQGYGVSRKMRPYHAALLGTDTLLVFDEAHLVPAFEKLLKTVVDGRSTLGPTHEAAKLLAPLKLLAMSATGGAAVTESFTLGPDDLEDTVVMRRMGARKSLTLRDIEDERNLAAELATHAWGLTENGTRATRIVVYCDQRTVAEKTMEEIAKHLRGDKKLQVKPEIELFVGARRVRERTTAADWLKNYGFIADLSVYPERRKPILDQPALLIATSAGEVGVDLDADHMVSDLVPLERMVQRLGRVNRLGEGDAKVVVLATLPKADRDAMEKAADKRSAKEEKVVTEYKRLVATKSTLERLPDKGGGKDCSPGAIIDLKQKTSKDAELRRLLEEAITPAPIRPALTRPLVEAWSMTALEEHTGRPNVEPWLRGWDEDEKPQTGVVWRRHLPVRTSAYARSRVFRKEVEDFFEAAPPHLSEALETDTFQVVEWLKKRAEGLEPGQIIGLEPRSTDGGLVPLGEDDIAAIVLNRAGDMRQALRLSEITSTDKNELNEQLGESLIVVDARLAGLSKDGLLDTKVDEEPETADDGGSWIVAPPGGPLITFRIKALAADQPHEAEEGWYEHRRFVTVESAEEEPIRELVVEKWHEAGTTEEDFSITRPQLLDEHQQQAETKARDLARRLGLPAEYQEMLGVAARLHDEGKRSERWQRAFRAPPDGTYAKTKGPIDHRILDGYRHELGSLIQAEKSECLSTLRPELRDLALHAISAHHGFARPIIGTNGFGYAPPSALGEKAKEVALRFARLQKHWGPWGLAWWETLLRAADHQASRQNETGPMKSAKGGT